MLSHLPKEIEALLKEDTVEKDAMGRSKAGVFFLSSIYGPAVLKIEKESAESLREYTMLSWLYEKGLAPKVYRRVVENEVSYLLMARLQGKMAAEMENLQAPEKTARFLAEGIKMLAALPARECPVSYPLAAKLEAARERVAQGLVNMADWEAETEFTSPATLLAYLEANKPEETLSVTHGDYCLPNVFFAEEKVTGFVDLGRAGLADVWQDIAVCVRSLRHNFLEKAPLESFFAALAMKPNREKINYYILLDELF
jgi:aminoglycoside phosphotransferase